MNDAEAVRRALAGDDEGHRHLFTRHYGRVVATCRSYPALDTAEAEDAAQDAFVRAFRALPSLRDPAHFGRWVLTIAHNRCRTLSARWGRRSNAMRSYLEEVRLQASEPRKSERELLELVLEEAGDERIQRVARMYWLEGYTSGEIEKETGVPVSTVTTWMSRLAAKVRARVLARKLAASSQRVRDGYEAEDPEAEER